MHQSSASIEAHHTHPKRLAENGQVERINILLRPVHDGDLLLPNRRNFIACD